MRRLVTTALILTGLVLPPLVHADNNARDYIAAPAGTSAFVTYYFNASWTKFYDNGSRSYTSGGTEDLFILRPIQWLQCGPFVCDPQALIIGGQVGNGGASGLADPQIAATFWFINKPSDKLWVGFTPFVTIPIGEYDKNRPQQSMGGHRWVFKPEFGMVKGFADKWYFDVTANVQFFTKNNEYHPTPTTDELEQKPLYTLESHLSYDFTKSFFGALDYYGHFGGENKIDGDDQGDIQISHRVGVTGAYAFAPGYQLMLTYMDDIHVHNGVKANVFEARFLYAW